MSYLSLDEKNPFRVVSGIERKLSEANQIAINWHHEDYKIREGFLNADRQEEKRLFKAFREKAEEMKIIIDNYLNQTKDEVQSEITQ